MDVLNYLKENPKICELSEFNIIKNMKYMDILRAYFSSYEFEQSIIELYNKERSDGFIWLSFLSYIFMKYFVSTSS